jgi:Tfp pilus assembly protein PilF
VAQRPADGGLRLQLGRRLMRVGALDEAVAELQKAVPDARVRHEAHFDLARCFHDKGFLDLARSEYERAGEGASPGGDRHKEIQYNLGAFAEAEGKSAEARARYASVFEIDIGFRDVAAKMEKLRNS